MSEYMQAAWQDLAPRTRWDVPVSVPRQKVFIVVLKEDGLEDFELPVSTIVMRRRDVKASYIRVTVPNATDYTEEILARIDGRMVIYAGEQTADGERHLEELIYANIQNIYFNTGARGSENLTLAGTRFITHSNPVEADLAKVHKIAKDASGRYRARCGLDFFLKPTDTVRYEDESFEVDFISQVIAGENAYMDVEGA